MRCHRAICCNDQAHCVCVDGGEKLGPVVKAQLLVGLPQVDLGERLTSSQHVQEILRLPKWVLLDFQSLDFVVTT